MALGKTIELLDEFCALYDVLRYFYNLYTPILYGTIWKSLR